MDITSPSLTAAEALVCLHNVSPGPSVEGQQPSIPDAMTAEEALALAEREGLTLVRSNTNKTGFKNLQYYKGRQKARPYQLKISLDGRTEHIGSYATPEEAALAYARLIGPEASAREAAEATTPPMTPEEAIATAAAEGLQLVRSDTTTGFKHVVWHKANISRPYALRVRRGGQLTHLGQYATPEEAALECARYLGSEATTDKENASPGLVRGAARSADHPAPSPPRPAGARAVERAEELHHEAGKLERAPIAQPATSPPESTAVTSSPAPPPPPTPRSPAPKRRRCGDAPLPGTVSPFDAPQHPMRDGIDGAVDVD